MRKLLIILAVLAAATGLSTYANNAHVIKPMIKNSVVKAYSNFHGGTTDIELVGSNIPWSFAFFQPGDVVTLVKVKGKSFTVVHHVEFFDSIPVVSQIAGNGKIFVRLSEESRDTIASLK